MYYALNLSISPKFTGVAPRTLSGFYRSGEVLLTIVSVSSRLDVHVAYISNLLVNNGVGILGFTSLPDISTVVANLLTEFATSSTKSRLRLTAV